LIEKYIYKKTGIDSDRMGDNLLQSDEDEISKMFIGQKGKFTTDEELAIHIMHRFNIDRETMETMPAFDPHIKPMFSKEIEK